MDVDDTPAEADVRARARAWLASVAKPRGEGDGDWRAFRAKTDDQDAAQLETARSWQRTKFDAGWAAPHWPREFGGQGLSGIEAGVVAEEEARFDVAANFFVVGIDMAGPTLMAHGTPEQQKRFLEPMLRGDESWCQLFSEPGSGSDLASLSTRAERDGDEWVLTGQKVWTSSAHTFWPASTHSSPSRSARVLSDARSEPAPGSLKSWHQISSPRAIGGSRRRFCSSEA